MPTVPRQDTQVLGPDGKFTLPWYGFFRDGGTGSASVDAEIAALNQAVLALQSAGSFSISATQSVRSTGQPANGVVSLALDGDLTTPEASTYYGTDDAGTRTFHEITLSLPPTFIAAGTTYTVPVNKQALFALPIDIEGTLVVDGALVEV